MTIKSRSATSHTFRHPKAAYDLSLTVIEISLDHHIIVCHDDEGFTIDVTGDEATSLRHTMDEILNGPCGDIPEDAYDIIEQNFVREADKVKVVNTGKLYEAFWHNDGSYIGMISAKSAEEATMRASKLNGIHSAAIRIVSFEGESK